MVTIVSCLDKLDLFPGGALLTFLRKQGSKQTLKTLVQICEDAAAGMAYLESKNCLHRYGNQRQLVPWFALRSV